MATVSLAPRLDPISQFSQFFSSLSSLVFTAFENTETAFRRVQVMKQDAEGNMRIFDVKNSQGQVISKSPFLTYIEDVKTGDLQLDEPLSAVASKCALVAIGSPFYTFGKMSWYAFHTPLEITVLFLDTIAKAGEQFVHGKFSESGALLTRGISQITETFGKGVWEVIKAPLFGVAMAIAGLYGIFKPYHGRRVEALIENAWQQGISYKNDLRTIPERPGENCWEAFVKYINSPHPFYLAHCFQIRGNISDPHIHLIRREPLTR